MYRTLTLAVAGLALVLAMSVTDRAAAQTTTETKAPATTATAPAPSPTIIQRIRKASQEAKAKPLTKTTSAPATAVTETKSATSPVTTSAIKSPDTKAATAQAPKATTRCTRLAFSVNDYGKDGPTKDAQALLDKHIADWAQKKNIKKYSVGKKTVKCELFLDFGVFDEHTCTAQAPVCW